MSLWEVACADGDGVSLTVTYNAGCVFICDVREPLYTYEGPLCSAAQVGRGHVSEAVDSVPALFWYCAKYHHVVSSACLTLLARSDG